jgi:hypothetical protein
MGALAVYGSLGHLPGSIIFAYCSVLQNLPGLTYVSATHCELFVWLGLGPVPSSACWVYLCILTLSDILEKHDV